MGAGSSVSRSDCSELSIQGRLDVRAFLALSLRNGALNVLTLGVHRFWGRSELRRWIWGAIDLDDEPLDYGGGGLELLIGFLLRLTLVGGALAAVVWGLRSYGIWGAPIALAGLAAAGFFEGFSRFAGFVYLAARTEWRGAVFVVDGSPARFALGELQDAALSLVTLGWRRPRADRTRDAKLWGGLRHQGRVLTFDAAGAARHPLYSAFAIGWFGTVMIGLFSAGVLLGLASGFFPTPDVGAAPSIGQLAALSALTAGLWLLLRVIWAPYGAARRTAIAAGFGFSLELGWRESAAQTLTGDLARLVSLGALSPWAQAREWAFVFARLGRRATGVARASVQARGEPQAA